MGTHYPTPRMETLSERKLVGKRRTMNLVENQTAVLWGSFMPRRKEIANNLSADLISMLLYPPMYFEAFDPACEFEKWAAVEVSDLDQVPADMEGFVLRGGLYAVFDYKGSSSDLRIFQYIFETWLPASAYALDDRPHFQVLGERYKNDDVNSEEEIWIPVKERQV
jgi:AraC family transcriptional regulator